MPISTNRRGGRWPVFLCLISGARLAEGASVTGEVRFGTGDQNPVPAARVTLFTPDLAFFREVRTNAQGLYSLEDVPPGTYALGACALRLEYQELNITVGAPPLDRDFSLGPEVEPGRWDIIGNTLPEFFDATDIGILRADGKVFFCHDTVDPILFNPATGQKSFPAGSGSSQGCMNASLLGDGRILMAGGQDGEDPGSFRDAVRWVKTYDSASDSWQGLSDLENPTGRWYPGLARLADGSFLIMGGGTRPNAERTPTCERFDLASETWSFTGSMINPCEFPPSALLFTGEVLATWWPPQLYNPVTGQWRLTGNLNQPNRFWPGHSDHSIVVLSDGRVLAIGVLSGPDGNTVMGEMYDPVSETWSLTSNPGLVRLQTEVVQLPDGRVLVAGGETETNPPPVPHVLGVVKWSDLYDPDTDSWRRVADQVSVRADQRGHRSVRAAVPFARCAAAHRRPVLFRDSAWGIAELHGNAEHADYQPGADGHRHDHALGLGWYSPPAGAHAPTERKRSLGDAAAGPQSSAVRALRALRNGG